MIQRHRICVFFVLGVLALPAVSNRVAISTCPSTRSATTEDTKGSLFVSERDEQSTGPEGFQGWTPQPNGRGTIDIIWSCVFTIFLCSWSVLCLNVPAENDPYWKINWRKCMLTGLGILGPEFILQLALGQWISARRSKQQFHASGFTSWAMNHAFFADMGGFVLQPPDWVPFPVNAKQLHYLVDKGYIPYPPTTKAEIKDRNKIDALLRGITVLQTLWFVMNTLARVVQHLAVTTFELTTVGFIFCTLGTHVCWAHKPADVEVPITLYTKTPLRRMLIEAGDRGAVNLPYSQTPLDFVSRKEWSWSLWWSLMMKLLRTMRIRVQPKIRPITRIPNDNWPELPSKGIFILGFVDMCYAGIYLAGWNFRFATDVERTMWRGATTIIFGIVAAYLIVELYAFHIVPALPSGVRGIFSFTTPHSPATATRRRDRSRRERALDWMRNNSQNKDPQLYMPLKASIPITIAGAVYCFARGYILLECVVALRRLPSSAYTSVSWSNFLPHV